MQPASRKPANAADRAANPGERPEAAKECGMDVAPEPDPAQFAALTALFQQGRLAAVLEQGEPLSARHPRCSFLHVLLGSAHAGLGRFEPAIACFTRALEIEPDNAEALLNLGVLFANLGRDEEAITCFSKVIAIAPADADAHNNLAILLGKKGRHGEAIAAIEQALRIRPAHAVTHLNLGNLLKDCGRTDEAVAAYRKAIACRQDYAAAYNNLGHLLGSLGRNEESASALSQALAIKPDFAEAHNNLGVALSNLGRHDQAIVHFRTALKINPAYAEAHYNAGSLLGNLGHHDQAIACFDRALRLKPSYARARAWKLHELRAISDWDGFAADAAAIAGLGIDGEAVPPFLLLSLEDDPARHLIRARRFAEQYLPATRPSPGFGSAAKPARLQIGYFSADFHDHATMYLMARLFELHDRGRFRIHAFSYGPETGDAMRARVKRAFDVFHDVRALGDEEIANLARREGIDIAVDLKGHTKDSRVGLFAYRAAPVQVSYLGYPGTMGAPFMDYLVADRIVVPNEQRHHYSEKLIYLPHCYQANDDTREIAQPAPTRRELGLPQDAFVFCCFNNSYKITAAEFDVWMRLLGRIEGSVLWLLKSSPSAERNLRKQAHRRQIDPDRLVFAERAPQALHLARHCQADLFLDTFVYNAHTTASDALWAGLPLVTLAGKGFASRVAASLLRACGLPELVADSLERYEHLAHALAASPQELAQFRAKLAAAREVAPLFRTEDFVRQLERGFEEAYRRSHQGDARDIPVPEG